MYSSVYVYRRLMDYARHAMTSDNTSWCKERVIMVLVITVQQAARSHQLVITVHQHMHEFNAIHWE